MHIMLLLVSMDRSIFVFPFDAKVIITEDMHD